MAKKISAGGYLEKMCVIFIVTEWSTHHPTFPVMAQIGSFPSQHALRGAESAEVQGEVRPAGDSVSLWISRGGLSSPCIF